MRSYAEPPSPRQPLKAGRHWFTGPTRAVCIYGPQHETKCGELLGKKALDIIPAQGPGAGKLQYLLLFIYFFNNNYFKVVMCMFQLNSPLFILSPQVLQQTDAPR